jgi:multidrug efflux pump subunit AcrB
VVAPPQITVTAVYPGASASVLVDAVTSVLEEELSGTNGMLYFESSSNSNGMAELTATFQPGTDPTVAQMEVQNKLKKAEARLPAAVLQQGLQVEEANAGFLMFYALTYRGDDQAKAVVGLADYAARNINNEIRRVPGVGKLQFFAAVDELKQIPGVQKFEVLKQTSAKNPYEYGISMEFENHEAYDLYAGHFLHTAFVEKYWAACVEDFLEID